MAKSLHNSYLSLYTKRIHTIDETENVHEKRVEGELRAWPHLTSMKWRCRMQCKFKPEKEEIDER